MQICLHYLLDDPWFKQCFYSVIEIHIQKYTLSCKTGSDSKLSDACILN